MILPIAHREECKRGGSAVIYKIVLDEEYNQLVPPESANIVSPLRWSLGNYRYQQSCSLLPWRPRNTFAMKTYHSPDTENYYTTEVDAFYNLAVTSHITSSIVGFHGGFRHNNTYNIILEWADWGTLEDYMRAIKPPTKGEDIVTFWHNLFNVTHGLSKIHRASAAPISHSSILNGYQRLPPFITAKHTKLVRWHQDVKPRNILVFSRRPSTASTPHFKLADLGVSHF